MDEGLKYISLLLKTNNYLSKEWNWLISKVEKRIKTRYNRWLSRVGILVLIKSVIEEIPVY